MAHSLPGKPSVLDFNPPNDSPEHEWDTGKIPAPATGGLEFATQNVPFRILVAGKTGVGKSTLVAAVFGVPPAKIGASDSLEMGTPIDQIERQWRFEDNDKFVLHDTGGFMSGENVAIDTVWNFIKERRDTTDEHKRLHCIWYCISCADTRPVHPIDKQFLKEAKAGGIPCAIVFTRFDVMVERHLKRLERSIQIKNKHDYELIALANDAAISEFHERWLPLVRSEFSGQGRKGNFQYDCSLSEDVFFTRVGIPEAEYAPKSEKLKVDDSTGVNLLSELTIEHLSREEDRTRLAKAQQDVGVKRKYSCDHAMQYFWQVQTTGNLPIIPFVGAAGVYNAFLSILGVIDDYWDIPGTTAFITTIAMRDLILSATLDVDIFGRIGYGFLKCFDITGTILYPLTVKMFLKILAGTVLIYERLFWKHRETGYSIKKEEMTSIVKAFKTSGERREMDRIIAEDFQKRKTFFKTECTDIVKTAVERGKYNGK